MEENEAYKKLVEEDRQRRKKANELGMALGLAFVALWVAAFTWRGELIPWKFLLNVAAGLVILAIPFALGYSLGNSLYDPWNKGEKLPLIIAAIVMNLFAMHFFGIF